jgi:hypothetical protein
MLDGGETESFAIGKSNPLPLFNTSGKVCFRFYVPWTGWGDVVRKTFAFNVSCF